MKSVATVSIILVFGVVFVLTENDLSDYEETVYQDAYKFVNECGSQDLTLCFKERALRYIEQLPSNIDIGAGMKIKQTDPSRNSRQYHPVVLPEEPRAREEQLDNVLMEKLSEYLSSHTFEIKVPTETLADMQRSFVEEGRKKKQKKGMMPFLMLFQLKAAVLGALAIKLIGFVAFKALLIAKVALTLASVIALKKLVGEKHSSTYEVVAHPHYDEHGHYDRSFSQELAYKGYDAKSSTTSNSSNK